MQCGGVLFLSLFLTFQFSDEKRMLISLAVGVEYAALDEIHQLFVPERAGMLIDVFIDSIGIALGICGLMLLKQIILKIKRKEACQNKQE